MPITSERVETERKPKLGGGGPGKIPFRRGYGGGDDGDNDRSGEFFSSQQRLRRARIGIAAGIACVAALFIGLMTVYLARQSAPHWETLHTNVYDWKPLVLPYRQLWINSTLLVLSSIALEMARRGMLRKTEFATMGIVPPQLKWDLPWLAITLGLGIAFLGGQLWVWRMLHAQSWFRHAGVSGSFFYLLTGLHGLHLAGGLIAILYAACGKWFRLRFESQQIAIDVTAWYWHFMGVLWFGIFALLHFA